MALEHLTGLPADTTPEAHRVQCDILRRLSPAERSRRMVDLIESVNHIPAEGVQRRHPEYSADQVRMAVIRMRLGDELFRKVYPSVEVAL